jgi:hypothetical protein
MAEFFDIRGAVFSTDDQVLDTAPLSPSADINEIRQHVHWLVEWRRVREQLAAGGVLAKMVTFRDLVKYKLLDLERGKTLTKPDDGGGLGIFVVHLACSDLTSDLEVNSFAAYFRSPAAFSITGIRASLLVASSSGVVTVDIKLGGVSIFSTKLTIDQGEKTSTAAAVPAVRTTSAIPSDGEVVVEITTAGTGARGLEVVLIGK